MAAFVRFVFTILIVGAVLNLVIVLLANAQSQNRRTVQYEDSSRRFSELVSEIEGHARRASIVMESQRVDAHGKALQSTLLIRQYHSAANVMVPELNGQVIPLNGNNLAWPLPVVRIVIPGDRLQVGGLLLDFADNFAPDHDEYAPLRSRQIALFGQFCGADEAAPSGPNAVDERFTYLLRDQTPELMRFDLQNLENTKPYREMKLDFLRKLPGWASKWESLPDSPDFLEWMKRVAITLQDPHSPVSADWKKKVEDAIKDPVFLSQVRDSDFLLRPQETFFDLKLWQYLWPQMPEIPRDAKLPWPLPSLTRSPFTATWLKPAVVTVRLERTYTAFVNVDGTLTLTEDDPPQTNLLNDMLKAGRELKLPADE